MNKSGREAWEVVVRLRSRSSARELAEAAMAKKRLAKSRWRRVIFECRGQKAAEKLAARLRLEVKPGTPIEVRRAAGALPWVGSGGDFGDDGRHHGEHHGGGDRGGGDAGNGGS